MIIIIYIYLLLLFFIDHFYISSYGYKQKYLGGGNTLKNYSTMKCQMEWEDQTTELEPNEITFDETSYKTT